MKAEISLPAAVRGVTVNVVVTGQRRTAFRIWLGCKLFKLAALVTGCPVDVSMETDR